MSCCLSARGLWVSASKAMPLPCPLSIDARIDVRLRRQAAPGKNRATPRDNRDKNRPNNRAGYAFSAGIALFSGSLYLYGWTGQTKFGAIAPVGGVSFIIGWLLLALKRGR